MKWEPTDIIKAVALIGAFVLFLIGAFMMWQGVTIEGSIDIKSSIISGSLKTGSAGLFIVFLSVLVILAVLITLNKKQIITETSHSKVSSSNKWIAIGFLLIFAAFIVSSVLSALGYGIGFAILAIALGFFTLLAGIILASFLGTERY